jgi:hypothetical protein
MDLPLGSEGVLDGATPVTALSAPATDKQRVVPANGASVYNADSVSHDVTWQKNKASTVTVLFIATGVAAGALSILGKKVVLDATDETLELVMEGAHTTLAPTFDVAAMETS